MKKLLPILMMVAYVFAANTGNAQSKLIHYWNFNNGFYTGSDTIGKINPSIAADYSTLDTSKARIAYVLDSGTSSHYITYLDTVSAVSTDYDTINARMGAAPGIAIRARNPSDSAQLLFYIPTTHYKNIVLKYASQSSSTKSGQLHQLFDYSTDSGKTWKTTALSETSDSAWTVYNLITVKFNSSLDTEVVNNPALVFRVKFSGNTTGTKGNNRFDNVTVEGDTFIAAKTTTTASMIHYWHFDNWTPAASYPSITVTSTNPAVVHADTSAIDTSKAKIVYMTAPGTSASYTTTFDWTGSGDSVYALYGHQYYPDSLRYGIRPRNPSDSMELRFYIPTYHYRNITLSFVVQSSSTTSGPLKQLYDYSTDSGKTWKTTALNMTSDSIGLPQFQGTNWGLVSLSFNDTLDPAVKGNNGLVFRVRTQYNNSGSKGNNRFDNVLVTGIYDTSAHYHRPTAVAAVAANAVQPILYPNPTTGQLYISTSSAGLKNVVIYSITGQRVYTARSNEQLISINAARFTAGMYYVNIMDVASGKVSTLKFVKQ